MTTSAIEVKQEEKRIRKLINRDYPTYSRPQGPAAREAGTSLGVLYERDTVAIAAVPTASNIAS